MSDFWIDLAPGIRYHRSSAFPLSADVVLLEGRGHIWLFDVGADAAVLQQLQQLPQKPRVILSHFHPDHTENLTRLDCSELYVGSYTFEKVQRGTMVKTPIQVDDGLKLRIIPLPSSHAKGSLALEINETYAFLGDGIYSGAKHAQPAYNATLLKDTITVLKGLNARWFSLSHADPFIQKKEDVIKRLEAIYAQRDPNRPDIFPNIKS